MDVAALSLSLRGDYGADKSPVAPASHDVHLFAGDPDAGGVELTTGYTPPTLTNNGTSWPTPTDGRLVSALVAFSFTDTLDQLATHWRLKGSDGHWWDHGPIDEGPWSGGAGASESTQLTITMVTGEGGA